MLALLMVMCMLLVFLRRLLEDCSNSTREYFSSPSLITQPLVRDVSLSPMAEFPLFHWLIVMSQWEDQKGIILRRRVNICSSSIR
jgi:hypothetical protein